MNYLTGGRQRQLGVCSGGLSKPLKQQKEVEASWSTVREEVGLCWVCGVWHYYWEKGWPPHKLEGEMAESSGWTRGVNSTTDGVLSWAAEADLVVAALDELLVLAADAILAVVLLWLQEGAVLSVVEAVVLVGVCVVLQMVLKGMTIFEVWEAEAPEGGGGGGYPRPGEMPPPVLEPKESKEVVVAVMSRLAAEAGVAAIQPLGEGGPWGNRES